MKAVAAQGMFFRGHESGRQTSMIKLKKSDQAKFVKLHLARNTDLYRAKIVLGDKFIQKPNKPGNKKYRASALFWRFLRPPKKSKTVFQGPKQTGYAFKTS